MVIVLINLLCLQDITYLGIYAIGQGSEPTHIPDSSLETGRASNKNFYGEDELKFHGGGIGTTFPGRGSFGVVDFFTEAADDSEGCTESTLEVCIFEHLEYQIYAIEGVPFVVNSLSSCLS